MSSGASWATAVDRLDASPPDAATIRAMIMDDLPACADVFYRALDRLSEVRHEAPLPRNEASLLRLYARLLSSHPAGGAVAELDGRVIGFGIAVERDRSWFLGFLFMEPASQGSGMGRRLLERILPASGIDAWVSTGGSLATCAEAIQPIATGLYASLGMRPRDAIYLLVGTPRAEALRPLPPSVEGVPFERLESSLGARRLDEVLASLDLAAVGHRRPIDHRDDRAEGRQGILIRDRADGDPLGYGYVQPSGRIGPAYMRDPELLEGLIRDLLGRVQPAGAWQFVVPGASAAMPALLRAGLRLDEPPIIYCATAPNLAVEGYLLRSYALP